MKRPKVIMHNAVSVDCSMKGFEFELALFYKTAARYAADIHLVGSATAKTGIEKHCSSVPAEHAPDFIKPACGKNDTRPLWVIPDTGGCLENLLHVFRRSGYCKDVVIIISRKTPARYLSYLKKRNYDYIVCGDRQADYKKALSILAADYNARVVLTDSGGTLNSILLAKGLVDEISVLVSPAIAGSQSSNLFRGLKLRGKGIALKLINCEIISKNYVLLGYSVLKK
jgi:2,5-diamino-6-(ribosylamino)-4(3H)-pyrimidinone 5'-phosphate reductase